MRIVTRKQFLCTFEIVEPKTSAKRAEGMWPLAKRSFANKGCKDYPESKLLQIGEMHHLDNKQVERLVRHLQRWLDTGSLKIG